MLLEIIPPATRPREPDTVLRAVKRIYNLGIFPEWWKLEPMDAGQWAAIDALIAERDPYCRGVVVLGLNAPVAELAAGFSAARRSKSARGFAVGRTLFHEPARAWLAGEIDDAMLVAQAKANFAVLIRHWQGAKD